MEFKYYELRVIDYVVIYVTLPITLVMVLQIFNTVVYDPAIRNYINFVSLIILIAYISWLVLLAMTKNKVYLNDFIFIDSFFRKTRINPDDIVSFQVLEDLPPGEPDYKIYGYINLASYGLLTSLLIIFMIMLNAVPIYIILTIVILAIMLFIPFNLTTSRYISGIISGIVTGVLMFLFFAGTNMIPNEFAAMDFVLTIIVFVAADTIIMNKRISSNRTLYLKFKSNNKSKSIVFFGNIVDVLEFKNDLMKAISRNMDTGE